MGEATVLILVMIQITLVCCCVYVIKSYCGIPLRLSKSELAREQKRIFVDVFCNSLVRRFFRTFLSEPEDEENQRNEVVKQALTQHQHLPYPQQQIPTIYTPQQMPMPNFPQYPMNLNHPHSPLPPYPTQGSYPHVIGFVIASPSFQTLSSSACSVETNLSEDPQKC